MAVVSGFRQSTVVSIAIARHQVKLGRTHQSYRQVLTSSV